MKHISKELPFKTGRLLKYQSGLQQCYLFDRSLFIMLRTLSFAFGRGSLGLSSTMIGRNRPRESLWYVFPGTHQTKISIPPPDPKRMNDLIWSLIQDQWFLTNFVNGLDLYGTGVYISKLGFLSLWRILDNALNLIHIVNCFPFQILQWSIFDLRKSDFPVRERSWNHFIEM